MKIFPSTCLLLAILSPGLALMCSRGQHDYSPGKKILLLTCSTQGGSCYTQYTASTLDVPVPSNSLKDGSPKRLKKWGCAKNCTNENYSFTTVEGRYFQTNKKCCGSPMCNTKDTETPSRKFNGQECPIYCNPGSEDCEGPKTIRCSNAENRCIEFVVVHNKSAVPDKFVRVCGTPSFCQLAKTSMYSRIFSGTITQARCCDSMPSSQQLNFEG
ncbi:uncharacterized protein LOC117052405 isoform X2 [Lacerta agilis]|uniref:uncharacterized protein LOC117052405 isoform X2 n=1 Tax=Lacerta agilis TaxID=80427 RepID=UPI0014198AB8|nr:uncharacterized protein LOC117052405 isoform X2 [Lacerta agilis]